MLSLDCLEMLLQRPAQWPAQAPLQFPVVLHVARLVFPSLQAADMATLSFRVLRRETALQHLHRGFSANPFQ